MRNDKVIDSLRQTAQMLDKCADDVPYELSAKSELYFRMIDAAKQARGLIKELQNTVSKTKPRTNSEEA